VKLQHKLTKEISTAAYQLVTKKADGDDAAAQNHNTRRARVLSASGPIASRFLSVLLCRMMLYFV